MSANFQLYLLSDPNKTPLKMNHVDEMICRHFNQEIHPTQWYFGWFDSIGWNLANGRNFDQQIANDEEEIRTKYQGKQKWIDLLNHEIEIIRYMKETFGFNQWYAWGRS